MAVFGEVVGREGGSGSLERGERGEAEVEVVAMGRAERRALVALGGTELVGWGDGGAADEDAPESLAKIVYVDSCCCVELAASANRLSPW